MVRVRAASGAVALLSLLLWVGSLLMAGEAGALVGDRAPDLVLPDLEGKPVQLSRLTGKVVVVNFWATWCDPCRDELPDFVKLHQEYRGRGLEVIGISMDKGKDERVKAFVKEFGIDYPIVIGDIQVARQWLVRGIPMTFLVDRAGKIARVIPGATDKRSLEEGIRPLLGIAPTGKR